jgi:ABC-type uncharacterized transport system involved in gliding motility auxiliary subunit
MSTPESPNARSSRHSAGLQSILKILLAAGILVMVNWLGFKHFKHIDLSESQYYALSAKTKDELAKLDAPLHIYTLLDSRMGTQEQQIENLIKEYVNAQPKYISYEKIDSAMDPKRTKELYDKLHFSGADYLVILQYGDKTPRFVKQEEMFDVNPMNGQAMGFKGEQQLTGAITALLEGKPSKVYFTEGHGEHNIHDSEPGSTGYGQIAAVLKDDNVETTSIDLAEKGEVPADAEAVVIAGPSKPLAPVEITAIDKYLQANGKLMILLDPYNNSGLETLLQKYGLKYEDDLVLRQIGNGTPGSEVAMPYAVIYQGGFSMQPITQKLAQANLQVILQDARSITLPNSPGPEPSKTQFLLQTDADSWGWIGNPGALPTDPKTLTYNKVTDIGGPLTIAAQYDGGTTTDPKTKATVNATRIVAVGVSKFVENDTIEQVGANFFSNSIDWLVKKDAVLDIAPKKPTEYGVTLSPLSQTTLAWTVSGVIPGVALMLGILVWFSRRK